MGNGTHLVLNLLERDRKGEGCILQLHQAAVHQCFVLQRGQQSHSSPAVKSTRATFRLLYRFYSLLVKRCVQTAVAFLLLPFAATCDTTVQLACLGKRRAENNFFQNAFNNTVLNRGGVWSLQVIIWYNPQALKLPKNSRAFCSTFRDSLRPTIFCNCESLPILFFFLLHTILLHLIQSSTGAQL